MRCVLFTQQLHPSTNWKVPASLPGFASLRSGGALQRRWVSDRSCANGHRKANGTLYIGQHQYRRSAGQRGAFLCGATASKTLSWSVKQVRLCPLFGQSFFYYWFFFFLLAWYFCLWPWLTALFCFPSSSQTAASYIIRNPQPRRSSQSQPVRGRDEEQDDIVSADVEEVECITRHDLRAAMYFLYCILG